MPITLSDLLVDDPDRELQNLQDQLEVSGPERDRLTVMPRLKINYSSSTNQRGIHLRARGLGRQRLSSRALPVVLHSPRIDSRRIPSTDFATCSY